MSDENLNYGVEDIALNLGGVGTAPEPMQPGSYPCEISTAEIALGKEPPHNPFIKLTMSVLNPEEYASRKLFTNLMLMSQSLWRLKKTLLSIGFAQEEVEDPALTPKVICESLIGVQVAAHVVTRMYQGSPTDSVTGISSISDLTNEGNLPL